MSCRALSRSTRLLTRGTPVIWLLLSFPKVGLMSSTGHMTTHRLRQSRSITLSVTSTTRGHGW